MKYCTRCGASLTDTSIFCGKCGTKAQNEDNFSDLDNNQTKKQYHTSTTDRKTGAVKWSSLILIVLVIIWGVKYLGPQINTSWAVDEACREVKSEVYSDYGEIPQVSGELIYKDGEKHVVVVKYKIPGWSWEASCACLVYGYREGNCDVTKMTTEMPYNYNYKTNLNELKARWSLD